ncbi:MAG: DUF3604 domain-containing protein [Rhabdochlamydiaceae bacterium]|nr:DUF3604 domain-containing protein [Rhabdochlamydiaceae bacterium]
MRRSICYCEPNVALAGDVSTWKFSYTTSSSLPKGTRLKFDLLSRGRDVDWECPQVNPKEKANLIWAELPDGKPIYAKLLEVEDQITPTFEFTLPSEVKAGDTLAIFMGSSDGNKEDAKKKGNRAQTHIQRRRPFYLYIDPKGKGDYREPEIFTMDVRGNVLKNIRIIAPSMVSKNKRFDVIIRFEDIFGNLSSNAPEGTLVEVSYEHLRENLNWKLFVPETGFINVPNLYFNEPGVYKIQLLNLQSGDKFFSAPIKCFADNDKSLFWGLLHGESERFDSLENIETCLRHFRDEKNCQFYATSSFESIEETSNENWKSICTQVGEFNEDFRFSTFLGMQWFGDSEEEDEEGLRQFVYAKDNKPILRKKDSKSNALKKIYKSHNTKELISIPSFSMAKGFETTFSEFTPEFERVVEIYNAWGCSECSEKEGNLRPIRSEDRKGVFESDKGSIRKALNNNCRFGFVSGGLDDRGIFSEFYESEQVQYSPGLTGIIAIEQTREALFQALYNRSCYATTGSRIIIGFSIAGFFMGSEINTKAKPGLNFNRHITGYIAGTDVIKEICIIRNGVVFQKIQPKTAQYEFAIDDSEALSKIAFRSVGEKPAFVYYYIRVEQEDGHIAWASPIWIDITDAPTPAAQPKKVKKTGKA